MGQESLEDIVSLSWIYYKNLRQAAAAVSPGSSALRRTAESHRCLHFLWVSTDSSPIPQGIYKIEPRSEDEVEMVRHLLSLKSPS